MKHTAYRIILTRGQHCTCWNVSSRAKNKCGFNLKSQRTWGWMSSRLTGVEQPCQSGWFTSNLLPAHSNKVRGEFIGDKTVDKSVRAEKERPTPKKTMEMMMSSRHHFRQVLCQSCLAARKEMTVAVPAEDDAGPLLLCTTLCWLGAFVVSATEGFEATGGGGGVFAVASVRSFLSTVGPKLAWVGFCRDRKHFA